MKAIQNSGVPLVGAFVGNKCEFRDGSIDSRAEVDILEARETAESLGMTYFETSAVSVFVLCCVAVRCGVLCCVKLRFYGKICCVDSVHLHDTIAVWCDIDFTSDPLLLFS